MTAAATRGTAPIMPPAAPPASPPTPREHGDGRTLAGYLLMPRPKDLVKALILPVTFVLGVLAAGGVGTAQLVRALVVLAALELLIYPARYQWNDVRGFVADQHHPAKRSRGRLPGPLERGRAHVGASCAVAVLRLLATAALVLLLPGLQLGGPLLALALGVFGVAVAYEAIRSAATGRATRVPPPVRPMLVLLWVVVGAGYVVRGVTGLALATDLGRPPLLAVAAVVTLWAFGVAFVTSRWALEALDFARAEQGRLEWTARVEQAREHLLALARWLPARVPADDLPADADGDVSDWAALRRRTPVSAPWNVAAIVAGAAAAVTGRLLAGAATAGELVVPGAVGGLAALAVVLVPRGRTVTVLAGGASLAGALLLQEAPRPALAVLPWLAVLRAHVHFSAQRPSSVGRLADRVGTVLRALAVPVARAVVGRTTWEGLRDEPARPAR
ncbi:hypothetical protein [Micromonospora sp. CPCC 205561]|uniref:hypothetical protein n=1 Tax=Micromonospora sp. CPCC 205561 TaxID=3122407 RepID=UPI002FF15F80